MCGEDYKTIREAVAKIVLEGKVERLDEICEVTLCHLFDDDVESDHGIGFSSSFTYIFLFVVFLHRDVNACHSRKQFTFYYRCTEKSPRSMDKPMRASIPNLRFGQFILFYFFKQINPHFQS